jgi:signal transduction histidine kinase
MEEEPVPLASAAAWSPTAAPTPRFESKVLTLDDALLSGLRGRAPGEPENAPEPAPEPAAPAMDRLAALRDIARRLRSAPDAEETLQFVIDTACSCTGSDAGMLTLQAPHSRQVVSGTALGAGPYISVPLRVGGPTFGEIVLTRLADAAEYASEEETFGELVAEYVAKAVSGLRRGTVISQEEQDFIDRVTEELRSPLASAVNGISVVAEGKAGEISEEARRYLAAARDESGRLLATIEALMQIAHLRPPELREMETFPLGPWLAAAVARHAARAQARGITMTHRPPPEGYLLQGVPSQLDTLIDQVLDNAIKFTDAGGRVDVTAGIAEGMLRISVADTGMGFDNGEANRMTECFARAITAEAARVPGLGVGLFLANEIVKNHNGRLWLDSRRDEGTQVHVMLPPKDAPPI